MKKETEHMVEQIEKNLNQLKSEFIRNQEYFWRTMYTKYMEEEPIRKNYVLYEAYGGCGMVCNPYAIFKYLLNHPQYRELTHIWAIADCEANQPVIERYRGNPRVRFVEYDSLEYRKYLATAKYLVNNDQFPNYFVKRDKQIFLHTWNEIPRYAVGYDKLHGNVRNGNLIRNLLAADYLLAPTQKMIEFYRENLKLKTLFKGKVLMDGQPRSQVWLQKRKHEKRRIRRMIRHCGITLEMKKKVVVYAPAWRKQWGREPEVFEKICMDLRAIIEKNSLYSAQLLVQLPPGISGKVWNFFKKKKGFLLPFVDTMELLSITDLLILDYRGIYFDALVAGTPMICYKPDEEEYQKESCRYEFAVEMSVPYADNLEQLKEILQNFHQQQKDTEVQRKAQRDAYVETQKPESMEHMIDTVFGKNAKGLNVVSFEDDKKKKVLFYGGNLENNGITQSFLQLLDEMSPEKYDVTVITSHAKDSQVAKNIDALNTNVRVMHRFGPYDALLEEDAVHTTIIAQNSEEGLTPPVKLYCREARRCFGNSHFDYAIDYTGEAIFFKLLFQNMKDTVVVNWKHNILEQEQKRGKKEIFWKPKEKENFGYYIEKQSGVRVKEMELIPLPDKARKNYSLIDMFWDKKEQEILISSFKKYHEKEPDSCLYRMGTTVQGALGQNRGYEYQCEDGVMDIGQITYPIDYAASGTIILIPEKWRQDKSFLEELAGFNPVILFVDLKLTKDLYDDQPVTIENYIAGKKETLSKCQELEQKLSEVKQKA